MDGVVFRDHSVIPERALIKINARGVGFTSSLRSGGVVQKRSRRVINFRLALLLACITESEGVNGTLRGLIKPIGFDSLDPHDSSICWFDQSSNHQLLNHFHGLS